MESKAAIRPTVVLCVAVAASFSFLLGYDIGIMSGAKRLVARDLGLTGGEVELLVGILNVVSAFGGLASGSLADVIGRRGTIGIACVVCIFGSLSMALAPSYNLLLVGRVVTGLGIGSSFQVSPLYIAEVSPRQIRGKLVAFFDMFINVGILAGYVVGYALAGLRLSEGWRWMLGLGCVPAVLICLALAVLPESPRFLVAHGREGEAKQVLDRIYAPDEARATLALLREDATQTEALSQADALRRICCPSKGPTRMLLLAGMGVAFAQQATGVEAAVYYTPETLEAVGIKDESNLLLATVAVGCIKVGFIVLAAFLVDRQGRVPLLLLSNIGIAVSQGMIALNFALGGVIPLALLGQCTFMAAFSIGAGPCSMMVASELFPLQLRGYAMGVATLVNRVTSGLLALSFLSLTRLLTPTGTFCTFTAVAVLATLFVRRYVPETKGQSLEEIEKQMAERFALGSLASADGAPKSA